MLKEIASSLSSLSVSVSLCLCLSLAGTHTHTHTHTKTEGNWRCLIIFWGNNLLFFHSTSLIMRNHLAHGPLVLQYIRHFIYVKVQGQWSYSWGLRNLFLFCYSKENKIWEASLKHYCLLLLFFFCFFCLIFFQFYWDIIGIYHCVSLRCTAYRFYFYIPWSECDNEFSLTFIIS